MSESDHIDINFKGVPDQATQEPVPDGVYECKTVSFEPGRTKSGDLYWRLCHEILGGPPGTGVEVCGRRVYDNLVFSPKAMSRAKAAFKAYGFDVSKDADIRWNASDLIGRAVRLALVTEEGTLQYPQRRNAVAYRGYLAEDAPGPDQNPNASTAIAHPDEIPF
jgi:hypothetical protein